MISVQTDVGALSFDPSIGNIPQLRFFWQGQSLSPLATAPWVGERGVETDATISPVERKLAGDFACAPFGKNDVDAEALIHGWSANSAWSLHAQGPGWMEAVLDRTIMGARLTKKLSLKANAPLLVQVHTIDGGEGGLTFAHHPIIDVAGGAHLTCSAKRVALTPESPIVPGHHALALGARGTDLAALAGHEGQPINLHALPIADGMEDFVTLVEEATEGLGWTAVVRQARGDIVFVLKDAASLPVTMLWHSNGGRTDYPWNGRNRGMLGIEDGRTAGAAGPAAAAADNPVSAEGVPTVFQLTPCTRHTIRHVIGAIPNTHGWDAVTSIALEKHAIAITGDGGQTERLLFHDHHLFGPAAHA
ncbi:MAG: hypothetical protein KI785_00435 [Devosiaceae bacterium]|nr:hypothetical protein [Devosiaceae bacterium MH13]